MNVRYLTLLVGALAFCGQWDVAAQQPAPAPSAAPANPLDAIPEKLPFNHPYGPAISAQRAQAAIEAAAAEASRRGWPLNIAVVDSGANLVAFLRMDGAQLGIDPDRRAQGARRRAFSPAHESLRGCGAKGRLQVRSDARRCRCLARRYPADRGGQADRRDRLLGRQRLAGRGGVLGWRGDDQQIASKRPSAGGAHVLSWKERAGGALGAPIQPVYRPGHCPEQNVAGGQQERGRRQRSVRHE